MKCQNCNQKDGLKYSTYASGKFCCKKCASEYSSNFNRSETNRKISKSIAENAIKSIKLRFCRSCGCVTNKNKDTSDYCLECRKYIGNRKLFEKLGISTKNLNVASMLALDKLKQLYFEQKKSSLDIYKEYGIKENTLYWFFKKHNIPLRTLSKSIHNAYSLGKGNIVNPENFPLYKSGWYTTWFGKQVFLRSSYETKFAKFLDEKKVYYEAAEKRIKYTFNGENHIYIVDFYIPDWGLIVETKNRYFYTRDKLKIEAKIGACEKLGYKTVLLIDKDVDKFINNTESL